MENSIKEDLNYLDSMLKEYKQFGNLYNEDYEDEDRIYQAIEHTLSDYKRVLKENEEKDKQIEKYINMLATNDMLHVIECQNKDKIIDLMAEKINNHDIDEDICKQMGQKENCNEYEDKEKCKECIKQYFENKAKE